MGTIYLTLMANDIEYSASLKLQRVAGFCLLPDVDLRVPGIPHRGPTHTVWFALAVAVVCGVAVPSWVRRAAKRSRFGATDSGLSADDAHDLPIYSTPDATMPPPTCPTGPPKSQRRLHGHYRGLNPPIGTKKIDVDRFPTYSCFSTRAIRPVISLGVVGFSGFTGPYSEYSSR